MAIPQDKGISQSIHRNKALENLSIAFKQPNLIATRASTSVPVKHESDVYYVYDKDNLRLEETVRGNGAESNQVKFALSTATYRVEEHALSDLVTDRDRNNADRVINLDRDTTENLTEKILLRREEDLHELVMTKANWDQNHSLSTAALWSANTTVSNPIVDVNTGTAVIEKATGFSPNTLILNNETFLSIKEHVSFVDRIKYTSSESVSENLIARLFNIPKMLVGKGIQNTADEGGAESMAYVWTDSTWLGYVNPRAAIKTPSALYTFQLTSKGSPFRVKKWREEKKEADMIEVQTMYQHKIPASTCGYVIVNNL